MKRETTLLDVLQICAVNLIESLFALIIVLLVFVVVSAFCVVAFMVGFAPLIALGLPPAVAVPTGLGTMVLGVKLWPGGF